MTREATGADGAIEHVGIFPAMVVIVITITTVIKNSIVQSCELKSTSTVIILFNPHNNILFCHHVRD